MATSPDPARDTAAGAPTASPRDALLDPLPVTETTVEAAGIATAVLTGGQGPPMVLLHGPGESAVKWLRVIPELVATHRVIAPDLPAHGSSAGGDRRWDRDTALAWLDDLIAQTCPTPPVAVGQVIGGAIAARYAAAHPGRLAHLVLVDTLGLGWFRPHPAFAATMLGFLSRPTEASYERFMNQCSYDLDGLRHDMGSRWAPFVAYNVATAREPSMAAVRGMLRRLGTAPIADDELAAIDVPTTLIWGAKDRANRVTIARRASQRFGWPLHVIDDCADDPPRDRPEAFLAVLAQVLGGR